MTEKARRKRWTKFAAVAGALLGVVCHFVPPDFQAACSSLSKLTTLVGGC